MKRACQTLLVSSAILCALVLSASSTIALAARVGVPGFAHPFAVGLLEVASVAGTWIWLTEPRLRIEAAAVVGLASLVTGIGGVAAYGWFGIVAPVGLILTVHLLARAWTRPKAVPASPVVQATTEISTDLTEPITISYLNEVTELHPAPEEQAEDQEAEDPLGRVRQIVARGGGRGTVAAELDITPAQARTLIEKVKAA